jgi:hypothetical protein
VLGEHVGRLTFIVPLHISAGSTGSGGSTGGAGSGGGQREGRTRRRVLDVAAPIAGDDGALSLRSFARWDERSDAFAVLDRPDTQATLAAKLGLAESDIVPALDAREAFLSKLLGDGITAIAAVQEAVDRYRRAGAR